MNKFSMKELNEFLKASNDVKMRGFSFIHLHTIQGRHKRSNEIWQKKRFKIDRSMSNTSKKLINNSNGFRLEFYLFEIDEWMSFCNVIKELCDFEEILNSQYCKIKSNLCEEDLIRMRNETRDMSVVKQERNKDV